uniref:Natterin-4 n=1 Tax=Parasteatoda tepidariorum TaxID=114398 RepID=A0A2L2Z1T1_PARTP
MAYCGPTSYKPVAEWRQSSGGSVPPNAIEEGYDGGNVISVASAHHQVENIPAKLIPTHDSSYIA